MEIEEYFSNVPSGNRWSRRTRYFRNMQLCYAQFGLPMPGIGYLLAKRYNKIIYIVTDEFSKIDNSKRW